MDDTSTNSLTFRQKMRFFINAFLYNHLRGITFGDWLKLLRENRFAISAWCWPRFLFLTFLSVGNSYYRFVENRKYKKKLESIDIQPPIFILGHWRGGTTLLHNFLTLDQRFAFPTLFQVLYPHTFLCTEQKQLAAKEKTIFKKRPMDNMAVSLTSAAEEEFALCTTTFRSPYMGWAFPQHVKQYDPYLSFGGAETQEIESWKSAFLWFMKKLTLKYNKPLILKSPPNTARIRLLLEMFPDAKFVHIYRNPYTVFQSTKYLQQTLVWSVTLQQVLLEREIEEKIIADYNIMYDAFFEDIPLIPAGNLHHVCFEELEKNPLEEVQKIYTGLGLLAFDKVKPALIDRINSLGTFKKNRFGTLHEKLRKEIYQAWKRNFKTWGYQEISSTDNTK